MVDVDELVERIDRVLAECGPATGGIVTGSPLAGREGACDLATPWHGRIAVYRGDLGDARAAFDATIWARRLRLFTSPDTDQVMTELGGSVWRISAEAAGDPPRVDQWRARLAVRARGPVTAPSNPVIARKLARLRRPPWWHRLLFRSPTA